MQISSQSTRGLESFQSLLSSLTCLFSPTSSSSPVVGQSGNRSLSTKNDRSGSAVPASNMKTPPGIVPPASLYTAVIPPDEMAAFEASNFKNVKGVYKNCRGIWAAQWTDERGQRHTKYFNPKYYDTEAVSYATISVSWWLLNVLVCSWLCKLALLFINLHGCQIASVWRLIFAWSGNKHLILINFRKLGVKLLDLKSILLGKLNCGVECKSAALQNRMERRLPHQQLTSHLWAFLMWVCFF